MQGKIMGYFSLSWRWWYEIFCIVRDVPVFSLYHHLPWVYIVVSPLYSLLRDLSYQRSPLRRDIGWSLAGKMVTSSRTLPQRNSENLREILVLHHRSRTSDLRYIRWSSISYDDIQDLYVQILEVFHAWYSCAGSQSLHSKSLLDIWYYTLEHNRESHSSWVREVDGRWYMHHIRHPEVRCATKVSHTPECEHPMKSVRHMRGVRIQESGFFLRQNDEIIFVIV